MTIDGFNDDAIAIETDARRTLWVIMFFWTALIAAMLAYEIRSTQKQFAAEARSEALGALNKDLSYRRWLSSHGGAYVPVSKESPPNPYLSRVPERDITTPSGRRLTLVNPAYMTRQVHEMDGVQYGLQGHITSLRPIRPGNKPDPWERRVLEGFEKGGSEHGEMVSIEGQPYYRLMRGMKVEQGCLKCHGDQGYKLGDVRGGLSVSVPFAGYAARVRTHNTGAAVRSGLIWVLGLAGLAMVARRQQLQARERARAAAEKARLLEQLAQAQKMESVGRLAGGVAHDFNNMLNVILGYAEMGLLQVPAEGPLRHKLQEIRKAAQRSTELTKQLLAFARKQTAVPQVLGLNSLVEGMVAMLSQLLGENIALRWQPGSGLWPVRMDPSQVDQVVVNLCVNARDAITGVGEIRLETRNAMLGPEVCAARPGLKAGDYVVLSVSDNGKGIPPDAMEHLFEPFFTTKGRGVGTGLGLSTVYGIVQQNQGYIEVQSEPGKGTTFLVYLPRHQAPVVPAPAPKAAALPGRGSECVLLVEDEPAILALARQQLQSLGYTVLEAASPAHALELAAMHKGGIDLLLTDIIMPGMNGKDLADALRATRPGLRCLFMSGYTDDVIAKQGLVEPGRHLLQKPFDMETLAARVREALG